METPEGWRMSTIGQTATLQRGFDLPLPLRRPGPFPVVASNGHVGFHSEPRVGGPGVVTGRSGTIGKVFYESGSFWPLNTALFVDDFHGNDVRFVFHLLANANLRQYAASTGVPSLNRNFVHPQPVLVPPLPEQRKIAAILSSVDETIETTEAVIAQLQVVKKAMMQELLTRGMPGRHTRFKQTEIGEIPEDWKVERIGRAFEIQLGKMLNEAARTGEVQLPYLANRHVQWGRVRLDDLPTMTFSPAERVKFSLRPGDLLVCEGGEVGRSALWRGELSECYFQKAVHRLRPVGGSVLPQFMLHYMRFAADLGLFSYLVGVSSIAHLTREKLATAVLPAPSLNEQLEISVALDAVDSRIDGEHQALAHIKGVKEGLSATLLSGDLRVTPDEATE